jgi:galactose mutarotase-like enzyme
MAAGSAHPADPAVATGSFEGVDAVVLSAGGYVATFLPELGMLGASLTYDGQEYLSLHGGVDWYRQHHSTGLPLLHPWANRLSGFGYSVDGTAVAFDAAQPVYLLDGLPIHGTMNAASGWEVERQTVEGDDAVLVARFRFGDHPEQLRSFPFPHDLVVQAAVSGAGLRVTTTVEANGGVDVPVSFGWHPYFVWPGAARASLVLALPERDHLDLDDRMLPTGGSHREAAGEVVLGAGAGELTFDDAYRLVGQGARRFLLAAGIVDDGGRLGLIVELDEHYPYAQIYAPSGAAFVAIEPMTAPINALVSGEAPIVAAGDSFVATFRVSLGRLRPSRPEEAST